MSRFEELAGRPNVDGYGERAIDGGRPDSELARLASGGDQRAWSEIYTANYPFIYRYVAARVPETETADIAGEIFAAAVTSIDRFGGERPLLAWLYGIARHRVADYHRRARRREPFIARLPGFGRFARSADEQDETFTPPDPSRESDPAAVIDALDIKQALHRLTDDQREVVTLRYFVGMTTSEIAAILGRQPAAIYSLEARALSKLRRDLT